jgi:hypothetical protein
MNVKSGLPVATSFARVRLGAVTDELKRRLLGL